MLLEADVKPPQWQKAFRGLRRSDGRLNVKTVVNDVQVVHAVTVLFLFNFLVLVLVLERCRRRLSKVSRGGK